MALPQEIVDEILSYGDPVVTQKHQSVINQINYHRKVFGVDRRLPPISYLDRWNVYSGASPEEFYLYVLDKCYMKADVYRTACKYFRMSSFKRRLIMYGLMR